ncbi:MAG: heavy-metal-associated domain-containing protein [Bdellovibrionaceae bacterium]|nr:heavy-metal-associated domain-containing protein [Pseudobdellovibrionaceae bacterium]
MRRLALLVALVLPALHFAQAANTSAPATTTPAAATSTTASTTTPTATSAPKYELNVTGMHCESCVDGLTKSLESLGDIEKGSVQVDLKGNKATITLKKSAANTEALKKALNEKITAAGFTVTAVKLMN